MDKDVIAWTIIGVAVIVLIYFIATMLYNGNRNNAIKAQKIRVAKIEACRSIGDEALRTLCIVEGGAREGE